MTVDDAATGSRRGQKNGSSANSILAASGFRHREK
jgi:hypothetical protein